MTYTQDALEWPQPDNDLITTDLDDAERAPSLLYRVKIIPSPAGTHYRVVRVRDGVDEYTMSARFGTVRDAIRAVERLNAAHDLTPQPVEAIDWEAEEAYWRRLAMAGDWDDEEPRI